MRISNFRLNEIIENIRKKRIQKAKGKYTPLKGRPGSKMKKRLARKILRRELYRQRMAKIHGRQPAVPE